MNLQIAFGDHCWGTRVSLFLWRILVKPSYSNSKHMFKSIGYHFFLENLHHLKWTRCEKNWKFQKTTVGNFSMLRNPKSIYLFSIIFHRIIWVFQWNAASLLSETSLNYNETIFLKYFRTLTEFKTAGLMPGLAFDGFNKSLPKDLRRSFFCN